MSRSYFHATCRPASAKVGAGLVILCIILLPIMVLGQTSLPMDQEQDEILARVTLDQAKTFLEQNQLEEALHILEEFPEKFPKSRFLDEAAFLEAAALRAKALPKEATLVLEQLIEDHPTSPLLDDARLMLGALYTELGESDRALTVLNNLLNFSSDPLARREALQRIRKVYEQDGNYSKAIQTALSEMEMADEQDRRDLLVHIQGLVLQHMRERSLGDLLELYPSSFPGDLALIRLIELHTAQGDEVLAERDIRSFLHRFPNHPYAQTAVALLQSFIAKIKAHDYVVAAVLPFSGRMKPFGVESLNGIRLALEEGKQVLGTNAIGLVVKDSAASPSNLRHEFSKLLDEFHPIALIGPLLAREVQMVSTLADYAEIPFITPSATLQDVRQFGRFWFSTALTSSLQVRKLLDYSMGHLGYRRFCIFYPQSGYGKELSQQFEKLVQQRGGEIIAVESYPRGTTEVSDQIARLKDSDLSQYGEFTTVEIKEGEEREVYTPGFDAIFLPGQPMEVAFIAAQLAFYDIKVPLLGTNGWNSPNLIKWGGTSVEGGIFTDGTFPQSANVTMKSFIKRYRQRFDTTPSLFAIQSYDAMRLIIDSIAKGASSGPEVRGQLFRRHDLPTLNGLVAFGEGGILDRKIYLIQITHRQFRQIN